MALHQGFPLLKDMKCIICIYIQSGLQYKVYSCGGVIALTGLAMAL